MSGQKVSVEVHERKSIPSYREHDILLSAYKEVPEEVPLVPDGEGYYHPLYLTSRRAYNPVALYHLLKFLLYHGYGVKENIWYNGTHYRYLFCHVSSLDGMVRCPIAVKEDTARKFPIFDFIATVVKYYFHVPPDYKSLIESYRNRDWKWDIILFGHFAEIREIEERKIMVFHLIHKIPNEVFRFLLPYMHTLDELGIKPEKKEMRWFFYPDDYYYIRDILYTLALENSDPDELREMLRFFGYTNMFLDEVYSVFYYLNYFKWLVEEHGNEIDNAGLPVCEFHGKKVYCADQLDLYRIPLNISAFSEDTLVGLDNTYLYLGFYDPENFNSVYDGEPLRLYAFNYKKHGFDVDVKFGFNVVTLRHTYFLGAIRDYLYKKYIERIKSL